MLVGSLKFSEAIFSVPKLVAIAQNDLTVFQDGSSLPYWTSYMHFMTVELVEIIW